MTKKSPLGLSAEHYGTSFELRYYPKNLNIKIQ
jgi:hypothetical protein